MDCELDVTKHYRPVFKCEYVDCENYIYGPIANHAMPRHKTYECEECGEQYSWWKKNWPKKDVRFIIS